MANLAWLAHPDNPATAATITATSSNAAYPIANVKALPITTVWRSTSAAVQNIDVDFGSAQSADLIALVNHNLTTGAVITVSAGTTTGYLNFSQTMTYREFTAFLWLSAAISYRYWRINISDTSNPDSYIQVGYLGLGPSTCPNFTFRHGSIQEPEFVNLEMNSPYGVPFSMEMYRRQKFKAEFGPLSTANITILRDLYVDLKRDVYPFIFLPDSTGTEAYFMRMVAQFEERVESQSYTRWELVEDSYGKRI